MFSETLLVSPKKFSGDQTIALIMAAKKVQEVTEGEAEGAEAAPAEGAEAAPAKTPEGK